MKLLYWLTVLLKKDEEGKPLIFIAAGCGLILLLFILLLLSVVFIGRIDGLGERDYEVLWSIAEEHGLIQVQDALSREYIDGSKISYEGTVYTDGARHFLYESQLDLRYQKSYYGEDLLSTHGCGPTAIAMVVSNLTSRRLTPVEAARFCEDAGGYAKGQGTYFSLFPRLSDYFDLSYESVPPDQESIKEALSRGALIIAIMGKGHFTNSGHFIVLRGMEEGRLRILDPFSKEKSDKAWEMSIILSEAKSVSSGGPFWAYFPRRVEEKEEGEPVSRMKRK